MIKGKTIKPEELVKVVENTIAGGGLIYLMAMRNVKGDTYEGVHALWAGENSKNDDIYQFMRKLLQADMKEAKKFASYAQQMIDAIEDNGKPNG
jgi:hypothetical protein